MTLADLHVGDEFRTVGAWRAAGRLVSLSPCAATVELSAAAEPRTFQTAEGAVVTIENSRRRITWARDTEVERTK